ncbi:MAG: cell division protein ZapE [Candidatus Rickettsia vulgarisii]
MPLELKFDKKQLLIIDQLEPFIKDIGNKSFLKLFTKNAPKKKGIYLYGNVGNGKTTLMKYFFQASSVEKKLIIHYQNFMQTVHKDLHKFQNTIESRNNLIKKIATNYAKQFSVICIDEFEIKDITDAMIIGPLILELIQNKIFIFITSNTKPSDLYKDGLQRNSFVPIIKEIEQQFEIIYLNSNHDYRLDKIMQKHDKRIIYPIDEESNAEIKNLISDLTENDKLKPVNIEVFGRIIDFKTANKKVLVTDFAELFKRQLGYINYTNICQKFPIIVVKNIYIINYDNTDLAVRFINFVDNAYFYKVKLFMALEVEPAKIYQDGHCNDEFKRTISRLYEMNSDSYVNN